MANKSKPTFRKMEREKARQQRQRDKETRRLQSKLVNDKVSSRIGGEDPDIADIKPGPQPLPEQWNDVEKG